MWSRNRDWLSLKNSVDCALEATICPERPCDTTLPALKLRRKWTMVVHCEVAVLKSSLTELMIARRSQDHGTRQTSAFCVLFFLLSPPPPSQELKNWLGALPPNRCLCDSPFARESWGNECAEGFLFLLGFTYRKDRAGRCPSGAVRHIFWSPSSDAAFGVANLKPQVTSTDRCSELKFLDLFLGPPA